MKSKGRVRRVSVLLLPAHKARRINWAPTWVVVCGLVAVVLAVAVWILPPRLPHSPSIQVLAPGSRPGTTPSPLFGGARPPTDDSDRNLFREAFDIHSKLDRYQYSLVVSAWQERLTDAGGLFVRHEGATMKGIFNRVPVDLVVRDNRLHSMERGVWVERRIGEILEPLRRSFDDRDEQSYLNLLREPVAFGLPYDFDRDFTTVKGNHSQSLTRLGDEMMHGVRVTHYRFSGCNNCFGNVPRYFDISAWIDPQTKYIHRYMSADQMLRLSTNRAQPDTDITISRHNDPTVQLPTP